MAESFWKLVITTVIGTVIAYWIIESMKANFAIKLASRGDS